VNFRLLGSANLTGFKKVEEKQFGAPVHPSGSRVLGFRDSLRCSRREAVWCPRADWELAVLWPLSYSLEGRAGRGRELALWLGPAKLHGSGFRILGFRV